MKYLVSLGGKDYEVEVERGEAILVDVRDTPAAAPAAPVAAPVAAAPVPVSAPAAPAGSGTAVTAPMPGSIMSVRVKVGQAVKPDDIVCTLEAMKMENEIFAGISGTITSVTISVGASVSSGDTLVTIG